MFVDLLHTPDADFKVPKWIGKENIKAILQGAA